MDDWWVVVLRLWHCMKSSYINCNKKELAVSELWEHRRQFWHEISNIKLLKAVLKSLLIASYPFTPTFIKLTSRCQSSVAAHCQSATCIYFTSAPKLHLLFEPTIRDGNYVVTKYGILRIYCQYCTPCRSHLTVVVLLNGLQLMGGR